MQKPCLFRRQGFFVLVKRFKSKQSVQETESASEFIALHLSGRRFHLKEKTFYKKSKKSPSRIDRFYIHIDIYCFYRKKYRYGDIGSQSVSSAVSSVCIRTLAGRECLEETVGGEHSG